MTIADAEQVYRARKALEALRMEETILAGQTPANTERLQAIRWAAALLDHDDPTPKGPAE